MKKENPLSQAVQARVKPVAKKTITLPSTDVPRETGVGQDVRLIVSGTVQSIDGGNVTIEVTEVAEEKTNETQTPQVQRVVTQESHG